jgi:hypothetical protein
MVAGLPPEIFIKARRQVTSITLLGCNEKQLVVTIQLQTYIKEWRMAKQANVISHWHKLIEGFQMSPSAFYEAVEAAMQRRAVPDIQGSRVERKEGGLASANRLYVRIHRGRNAFDICGAPFGTGFFVSWWFTEPPLKFAFLYTLGFFLVLGIAMNFAFGIGAAIGALMQGYMFGAFLGTCAAVVGVPVLLWLLGNGMREGKIPGERTVLAMPLVGWAYERIFAPATYYAVDTALMFQDAVHYAVLEVIDCVTANKGVRALTEAERKPVMKSFGASA